MAHVRTANASQISTNWMMSSSVVRRVGDYDVMWLLRWILRRLGRLWPSVVRASTIISLIAECGPQGSTIGTPCLLRVYGFAHLISRTFAGPDGGIIDAGCSAIRSVLFRTDFAPVSSLP
jgi:hypothetical protein